MLMGEKVIVRQNHLFQTEILAQDPHNPDDPMFHSVEHIYQLTPYGMLLASVASCTAIVLHTYAQHHSIDLHEAEHHMEYERVFADDCEECEHIHDYKEQISEEIVLTGNLTPADKRRLFAVSKHCPIHKMLLNGVEVISRLAEEGS
jgi:putative redox protein